MYLPEGSCAPKAPLTGGPPGIPGNPLPADPNDFPELELRLAPALTDGVTADIPAGAALLGSETSWGGMEDVGAG